MKYEILNTMLMSFHDNLKLQSREGNFSEPTWCLEEDERWII